MLPKFRSIRLIFSSDTSFSRSTLETLKSPIVTNSTTQMLCIKDKQPSVIIKDVTVHLQQNLP